MTLRNSLYIAIVTLAIYSVSCSSDRNTWTSKTYHNLTAHYNGYYYANEEITKIEESIRQSNADDYNKILRIFPTFDSSLAKGYQESVDEAVKMASIAIQRHPNSKWVDDAYILVGKARLYSLDWGNAIQTFKYVNTKSKDPNAKHRAIISLIRTFTEHKEFGNAQAAIEYLLKEKLNRSNRKAFYLEEAYYYQMREDYDKMVRCLALASPLLKKRDHRGRIYFIIGQVYQKLGFESEAFNFYKKCLSTNPEYEIDFYARLYMAQVAEISKSRDINTARKSFRRLLKDRKNKEFRDKIYYELGIFELKQKNLDEAIANLNKAVREGNNKSIDGEAYLKLGEIYYDTLRDYELSQAYYDSAISALPKDFENYEAIKARQEILNEFVKNLKTIQWQDSLLAMANLDSATLRQRVDSVLAEKKRQEELANKGKKKKQRNRIDLSDSGNNLFDEGGGLSGSSDWYFGNPSAVSLGQAEFQRTWGDIALEDDWRRSQRMSLERTNTEETVETDSLPAADVEDSQKEAVDPAVAEFEKLRQQIPTTEAQKQEALGKIEKAYFRVGDIYYFDLLEQENAMRYYKMLLDRFPQSEFKPEALYKLYLLSKEKDPAAAEQYANILKKDFPYTTYAKILLNPDYLKESSETVEKQKALYKEAYENYQAGNYVAAIALIRDGEAVGETIFNAKLALLNALIIGKTGSVASYQVALENFIETNPDSDLIPYAQKLLSTVEEFQHKGGKPPEVGVYKKQPQAIHYFVLVYKRTENGDELAAALEAFNNANFKNLKLTTTNLVLDEENILTTVGELANEKVALDYLTVFNDKLPSLPGLQNHNFNKFVIANDNFNILYRTKGVNAYIEFFEKNYEKENE